MTEPLRPPHSRLAAPVCVLNVHLELYEQADDGSSAMPCGLDERRFPCMGFVVDAGVSVFDQDAYRFRVSPVFGM